MENKDSEKIAPVEAKSPGFFSRLGDQFGMRILRDYLIPAETNSFWYSLGGILGISIVLEFLTGFLLLFKYIPDAGLAYGITRSLINSPTWKVVINFHYLNAFVIFVILMVHLMRVFISGAYRGAKKGLWFVGIALAVLIFVAFLTGEALHWDEVGFAVPYHASEFLQAVHLDKIFNYAFTDLFSIPSATEKLVQIFSTHIAIAPMIILLFIGLHFYLIKEKGISVPFWKKPSGVKKPFINHVKMWFVWSGFILGAVLLVAAFMPRSPGIPPQIIPESPLYAENAQGDPGDLGVKPSFPISWTNGMNMFVEKLGLEEDIWGTAIGMALMLGSLIIIPFVDREENEPASIAEAFDLKKRGWAFLAIGIFWLVFVIGVISNILSGPG